MGIGCDTGCAMYRPGGLGVICIVVFPLICCPDINGDPGSVGVALDVADMLVVVIFSCDVVAPFISLHCNCGLSSKLVDMNVTSDVAICLTCCVDNAGVAGLVMVVARSGDGVAPFMSLACSCGLLRKPGDLSVARGVAIFLNCCSDSEDEAEMVLVLFFLD